MTEQPLFELKPKVSAAIAPLAIFVIISITLSLVIAIAKRSWLLGVLLIACVGLYICFKIMSLRATTYKFYKDKVEFYEGFLRRIQRTVPYSKITDTILTQSLLDRLLYTGTIQLVTAGSISTGSALFAKHRFAGIMLEFVPEPEKNFAKIQQFIHK
ncbi:MAG: PH domain-containing protein [Candidatus Nanoarchaeia archaeon]|jgi:membrane protein YdbS with pleckstrin-like domain